MALANFLAWMLQIAALIAAGLAAAHVFRWRHPQSRLRFFQILLIAGVLLPLLQPWRRPAPESAPAGNGTPLLLPRNASTPAPAPVPWDRLMWVVLLGGAGWQWTRLGFGIAKLHTLRRSGRAVAVDGLTGVDVREVAGLRGPAAFGWWEPVILLPSGQPSGAVREAALRHELCHVVRRDWAENIAERALAALLWFHPAVWWLLERIHLAREQAVDAEVAGAGRERDEYLESLLVSAGLANSPALPAASFVRRPRHLVERVAFLSKESPMSIRNTAASAALAALVSGGALAAAAFYFPLQLSAQQLDESGQQPLHFVRPTTKMDGTVVVELVVNAAGEVIDARVLSGPEELRKDALQAALPWRFKPEAADRRVLTMTFDFRKSAMPPPPPPAPAPPPLDKAVLEGVDYVGLSVDLQRRAAVAMSALSTGQRVSQAEFDALRGQLTAIDPSLQLRTSMRQDNGETPRLRLAVTGAPPSPEPPNRIRVGGNVSDQNLIHKVPPVYPPLAKEARIQGTVRFNVIIGKDGSVINLTLVAGHPLLVQSVMQAVSQWKYRPTLLNGQPVEVITMVDINFTLSE